MPLALWLLIGGVTAYLIYQSGKTAGASAAGALPTTAGAGSGITPAISGQATLPIKAANGHTYAMPVDANLPQSVALQLQNFFGTAGQTDTTVSAVSAAVASQGYTIAAGGVQQVWQQIQQDMGPLVQNQGGGSPQQGGGLGAILGLSSSGAPFSRTDTNIIPITTTSGGGAAKAPIKL